MASISWSRRDADGRSAGGKILRSRRRPAASRTPYAHPERPPEESAHVSMDSENPNHWLSGLMVPARMIATGAGKILSTVFGGDSSSSSSDEDEDSVYESDVDGASVEKSENKHLIRQLVMQDAFSSDEAEELIKLVKARVVDEDVLLTNIDMTPDTRTAAVMEAKRWLEEKKSGSGFSPKLNDQIYGSDQAPLIEGEMGSPVDVAKSYMQARPAWSSPSFKHVEFSTPSTNKGQNSKDEISKFLFPTSLQLSEAKRKSVFSGSWDILEEIRRVRFRATEERIATTPSKKVELSSAVEHKSSEEDPETRNIDELTGDQLLNSASPASNFDQSAPVDFASNDIDVLPEYTQGEHDRLHGETLPANGESSACNQYEDDAVVQVFEDARGEAKHADPDSKQLDGCILPGETDGSRDLAAENGFQHAASSLSMGDQNNPPCDKEMINVVSSSEDKADTDHHAEDMELQNQLSADTPSADEGDSNASGSRNSISVQYEELQDRTWSPPKRSGPARVRGRGRGKTRRGRGKR